MTSLRPVLCFCLAVVLSSAAPVAHAGTLDWTGKTWTGITGDPLQQSFNTGDNTVTFKFTDSGGAMAAAGGSPAVQTGTNSGYTDQLYWAMDASNDTTTTHLVITFANPVTSLTFHITDIDVGGANTGSNQNPAYPSWQDQLTVSAKNTTISGAGGNVNVIAAADPGNTTPYFSINNNVNANGTGANNSSTVTANTNSASASQVNGNLQLTFGAAVNTIYIDYATGPDGPSNPALQLVRITDLTFTTVPEPSTWAMIGALVGVAGYYVKRRRAQRRLAA